MASRALEVDYAPVQRGLPTDMSILESVLQSRPRRSTVSLEVLSVPVAVSETGEEIKIEVKPDRRGYDAAIDPIRPSLAVIQDAMAFEPGWDSYAARPIDRRSVRPTLQLILAGHQRCALPRVVPTAEGGFELHWARNAEEELEVTVTPAGSVRYDWFRPAAEGDEEGEGLPEATQALARFCTPRL